VNLSDVRNGSRYDGVKSIINYSDLWKNYEVLKLLQNMRLNIGTSSKSATNIKEFVGF